MECNLRESYLNAGLTEDQAQVYRRHLATCLDCREQVEQWKALETRLRKWAALTTAREASSAEAYTLMRLASASKRPERRRTLFIAWAAAFAVAASTAAAAFMLLNSRITTSSDEPPTSLAVRLSAPEGKETVKDLRINEAFEAPASEHIVASIQEDKVGLSPKTKVRLLRMDKDKTRLSLERGTVACKVAKRNPGGEFVVQAGPLTVTVVGTQFSVTRDAAGRCEVVVEEGVVIVRDKSGREHTLRAADRIETDAGGATSEVLHADAKRLEMTDALLNPNASLDESMKESLGEKTQNALLETNTDEKGLLEKTEPPSDAAGLPAASEDRGAEDPASAAADINGASDTDAPRAASIVLDMNEGKQAPPLRMWQNWIMSGRVDDAASSMRRFLKDSPDEPSVFALLADCERKEGNYPAAVRAYEKVMQLGTDKQRARAAYMAASVLQSQLGDHRRALKLFKSYKESAHAAPELIHLADVNIIRSLAALGRCKDASDAKVRMQKQGGAVIPSHVDQLVNNCTPP